MADLDNLQDGKNYYLDVASTEHPEQDQGEQFARLGNEKPAGANL